MVIKIQPMKMQIQMVVQRSGKRIQSYWLMRMKCQLCIELNFQVNDIIQCHNYNLVRSRQILPKHSFNFLKKCMINQIDPFFKHPLVI